MEKRNKVGSSTEPLRRATFDRIIGESYSTNDYCIGLPREEDMQSRAEGWRKANGKKLGKQTLCCNPIKSYRHITGHGRGFTKIPQR